MKSETKVSEAAMRAAVNIVPVEYSIHHDDMGGISDERVLAHRTRVAVMIDAEFRPLIDALEEVLDENQWASLRARDRFEQAAIDKLREAFEKLTSPLTNREKGV